MAKIYGQLEKAQLENTAASLSASIAGLVAWNTTAGKAEISDGTLVRALLRNDAKLVIGNSGTAADNIRLNRSAAGVLQVLPGGDATAEGATSTSLAQLDARIPSYTTGGAPSAGNAGRLILNTSLGAPQFDTSAAWETLAGLTLTQTFTNKTIGDSLTFSELGATPANPAAGFKKVYAKNDGKLYSLNSAGVEAEVGGGGGAVTTASNIGTAGVGLFKQLNGTTLEFKKVKAGTSISVTATGADEVEVAYTGSAPPSTMTAYTPTISGLGSCTGVDFNYCVIGPMLWIRGSFVTGTTAASEIQITLPGGYTVATLPGSASTVYNNVGDFINQSQTTLHFHVLALGGQTVLKVSRHDSGPLTPALGNNGNGNTQRVVLEAMVPIA
jgi:hypothetical protein